MRLRASLVLASALIASSLAALGCETTVSGGGAGANGAPGAGVAPPGGGSVPGSGVAAAAADPSQNVLIVTSKDEEVVAVDPNAGTHESITKFDRFAYVTSVDVIDRMLYVGAEDNSINAVDMGTKKLLWDVPLGRYETTSLATPRVITRDGVAYAAGVSGVLTAVDIATHTARWEVPLSPSGETDGYYSSVGAPAVTADRVFIGTHSSLDANYLHAIDRATGKRIWMKPIDAGVSGLIKLVGDTLIVPAHDLYALDPATGNVKWSVPMEKLSRGAGTPSVAGDKLLVQGAVGVAEGRLFCVSLASGQVLWSVKAGNDYAGVYAPTVVGGWVFGVVERGSGMSTTGNGRPFVADVATGAIVWQSDDVSVESSPVFANGRLFFHGQNFRGKGSIDNNVGLMALDASTGALLWLDNYFRYARSMAPIVIAKNGVFRAGADAQ